MEAGRTGGRKVKTFPKKERQKPTQESLWRLPLVGEDQLRTGQQKRVDKAVLLMEAATIRERVFEFFINLFSPRGALKSRAG